VLSSTRRECKPALVQNCAVADRHALPPNGKIFEKWSDSDVYVSSAPWSDGWFGRVCPMLCVGCSSRRVEDNAPYLLDSGYADLAHTRLTLMPWKMLPGADRLRECHFALGLAPAFLVAVFGSSG